MKTMASRLRWIVLLAGVSASALFAAAGKSDLVPSDKRAAAIATGTRLARPSEIPAVAPDIISPFSPPDFDLTDAPAVTTAKAGGGAGTAGSASAPAPGPAKMSSTREILETLTPQIPATGTIQRGSEFLLMVAGKNFKVGDIITIRQSPEAPKYDFEITSIKSTEFTLRYQGEIKTRAIVIKSSSSK